MALCVCVCVYERERKTEVVSMIRDRKDFVLELNFSSQKLFYDSNKDNTHFHILGVSTSITYHVLCAVAVIFQI